jgi:integrase/recombinase XerD
MQQYVIKLHHHLVENEKMIGIGFPMIKEITDRLKQLEGPKWCSINKWVYVKNSKKNLNEIFAKFKGIAWIDGSDFFKPNLKPPANDKLIGINTNKALNMIYIKLPVTAKQEWIDKIKSFPQAFYISKYKNWLKRYQKC